MKTTKVLAVLATVLVTGFTLSAQDEATCPLAPEYTFNGLSAGLWHADLAGLNDALADAGYAPLPAAVLTYGQESTFGDLAGLRIGFHATYGAADSVAAERRAEFAFTLFGGSAEWAAPRGEGASISFGLSLGTGISVLRLVDHRPATFEDALSVPFRAQLDRWLYTAEPAIASESKPFGWLDLKLRLGYLFAFGRCWTIEGERLDPSPALFGGPIARVSFAIDVDKLFPEPLDDETSSEVSPG